MYSHSTTTYGIIWSGDDMTWKCNFRALMERDGLRPQDVWKPIGVTRQQYGKWCRSDDLPSIGYVVLIHRVTGWTLEEMFSEE